jgi:hypothetical protein
MIGAAITARTVATTLQIEMMSEAVIALLIYARWHFGLKGGLSDISLEIVGGLAL